LKAEGIPVKRGVLRALLPGLAACLLLGLAAPALRADQEGQTVEDLRKKILEEKEKAERQKKQEEQEEARRQQDEGDADAGGFFWQLFAELFRILFVYSASERYADYPYAAAAFHPFGLNRLETIDEERYRQWGYANLFVDGTYLFNDRYALAGRLSANLLAVHLEGFSQVLFDPTGYLVFYSANAGLTLPFRRLVLNLFLGAFGADLFPGALFSFGAGAQVFLPGRSILDVYSLNAVYATLHFHYLAVSLNYAFSAVNLGVGFNLNNYADTLILGPLVRLSFWL
jgi:hypothetical protein